MPAHELDANQFHESGRTLEVVMSPPWLERYGQLSALTKTFLDFRDSPSTWVAMRLFRKFKHSDDLTPLALEGLMLELLAQVGRQAGATRKAEGSSVPPLFVRARDFLHAHFKDSPSLETIAAAARVYPAHLTRAFRRHYRCTLGDYARRLRVEYTCHLLSTTESPLAQIALEAGFADQGHFTRTFKTLTTMTPAQYRKK